MNGFEWIPMSVRKPETGDGPLDWRKYLTCNTMEIIETHHWHDGWNCSVDFNGNIDRTYEMADIVAWAYLPEPYKEDGEE